MYLGLDLGTSGLKAVLISHEGEILAQASATLTSQQPYPNWSEQDPQSWWQACKQAIQQLHSQTDLRGLKAIGLSGQMHGATLLDQQGNVLRPCILWNDGRSHDECEAFEQTCKTSRQLSGNLAMPGFTAPKLLWLQRHEPALFEQIATVLLPKDYLRYRLTGEFATDMSDASGTLWLNPATRDWDDQLLAATSLTRQHMPRLYEGTQITGVVSPVIAQELGIQSVPVVAGAGDNAAGAIGMGILDPGQALLSRGTSGVLFVVSEQHQAAPLQTVHAFCHAIPNRWHQMGVTLGAASALDWLAKTVGQTVPQLLQGLENAAIEKTSVIFLPYLSGERTPHNNPDAMGQFFGLSTRSGLADMTLAVLEGVAFSMVDCQQALLSAGSEIEEVSLIGGGARSPRWRQILADCLQKTVSLRDGGAVGPGLGAARLALIGTESLAQDTDLSKLIAKVCQVPPSLATHSPNACLKLYYQEKLSLYRSLYQQTRSLAQRLAILDMT